MSLSQELRGYADRVRRFGSARVSPVVLDQLAIEAEVLERELERLRGGEVTELAAIEERSEPPGRATT